MTMPNDLTTNAWNPDAPAEPGGSDREIGTGSTRAQLKDVKDQVIDHARQSFRQARESAGTSINDSRHQAADRIGGIASAVRGTSERLRSEHQDRVADLTDSLADNVDRLSAYLRDRNLSDFRRDAEDFARRQPGVAVGIALAIGLIGARFLKSGSGGGGSHGRV